MTSEDQFHVMISLIGVSASHHASSSLIYAERSTHAAFGASDPPLRRCVGHGPVVPALSAKDCVSLTGRGIEHRGMEAIELTDVVSHVAITSFNRSRSPVEPRSFSYIRSIAGGLERRSPSSYTYCEVT